MRIATVCGTRPELIKLAPLVPELASRFDHRYLFTGQHYSPFMVQVFVDELAAPAPDRFLDVGSSDVDALAAALRTELLEFRPDVVVVYGDTNSSLAAGLAQEGLGCLLVHVEAGIRSFDRTMPEEVTRVRVDALADLRLAPTGLATWFLSALEGHDATTSPAVGNLVVDAWVRHRDRVVTRPLPEPVADVGGPYAVLTLHRQATVDDPEILARAIAELGGVPLPIFFPVHPRTTARLAEFGLRWPDNLRTCPPIGYLDFCRAMSGAAVLLTDSGGVQEEAITLDVPCVTLRPNTERMETVFLGANRLFALGRDRDLRAEVEAAIAGHAGRPCRLNPYGSGFATARIVALLEMLAGREPHVTFPAEQGFAGMAELRAAAEAALRRRHR